MAWAQKDLTNVGDVLTITNPHQGYAWAMMSYDASAVGTVILEGTLDNIQWDLLWLVVKGTGGGAGSAVAPGLYETEGSALVAVRARKTVGVASCKVRLSVSEDS